MTIMKYILSPCGTSLLTNKANTDERSLVFKYANEKRKEDIPKKDRIKLEKLINNVSNSLQKANNQEARRMSAELNGIIQIYNGKIKNKVKNETKTNHDFHLLLSTDTWLGEETAKLVKSWLEHHNLTVVIHRQIDLQTSEISSFQLSLSELIKKLSQEIPEYSKKGYYIIFNLTGGFKSVQGFLQSIANFYADETVYIFETSSELLRIPKLPIRLDALPIIEKHINEFRKLSLGIKVDQNQINDIPETLLFTVDEQTTLSAWGELLWEETKKELYKKELFPSPIRKIKYSKRFIDDVSNLAPDRISLVNKKIDQLTEYFIKGINLNSLDLKPLKGKPMKTSTHELDAWSDKDAKRIFGHFEGEIFVLDKLDKGLH